MKTKLILLALSTILYSCDSKQVTESAPKITVVHDSCEYIEVASKVGTVFETYSLTHKGNCKYCEQRRK